MGAVATPTSMEGRRRGRTHGVAVAALTLLGAAVGGAAIALAGASPPAAFVAGAAILAASAGLLSTAADRLAYALVAALVVFIPWNGIRFAGGAAADAVMVLAFAALLPLIVFEKRPLWLPRPMVLAGTGLVIAALITVVFPPNVNAVRLTQLFQQQQSPFPTIYPSRSNLSALVKFEISWLLLPLLIVLTATTRKRCRQLIDLWVAAVSISALVGVLDYLGIAHLSPLSFSDNRFAGLTIHPNYLAFTAVSAVPLALLWLVRGRRWTILGVIAVAALVGGVYVSGSRAATVAALIAAVCTFVAVPRLRGAAGIAVPVAGMLVIGLLVFTSAGHQIMIQLRLNSGNGTALASNQQRALLARVALAQFEARTISGVGFSVIEDAHNIYLQLLAAGGLIALASFASYIVGLAGAAKTALRGQQSAEARAASIAILAWLIGGAFDNQLVDKFLYVVPGLLIALAALTRREAAAARQSAAAREVEASADDRRRGISAAADDQRRATSAAP